MLFRSTDAQRTNAAVGLHHAPGNDGEKLGDEVMIDTYLALRCTRFIGNGRSNVSAMIALLKDWPEDTCRLLAPSQLLERQQG